MPLQPCASPLLCFPGPYRMGAAHIRRPIDLHLVTAACNFGPCPCPYICSCLFLFLLILAPDSSYIPYKNFFLPMLPLTPTPSLAPSFSWCYYKNKNKSPFLLLYQPAFASPSKTCLSTSCSCLLLHQLVSVPPASDSFFTRFCQSFIILTTCNPSPS